MSDDGSKNGSKHRPGYGHPPEHSRFVKGRSGNPNGRPSKQSMTAIIQDRPLYEVFRDVGQKMITMRENGHPTSISQSAALVHAVFNSAINGNARSQSTALSWILKAEDAERARVQADNEVWSEYKRVKAREIAEARSQKKPEPLILPHPDDIIIDLRNGPRLLGPANEEELRATKDVIALRDLLIMQDAYDWRCTHRLDGAPNADPGAAGLIAMIINNNLAPRFQIDHPMWLLITLRHESRSKRDILKSLYQGWQRLGFDVPRGFVFPALHRVAVLFQRAFELLQRAYDQAFKLDDMTDNDWIEHARWIITGDGEIEA